MQRPGPGAAWRRGLAVAGGVLLTYGVILAIALTGDWQTTWRHVGVVPAVSPFHDLRDLTETTLPPVHSAGTADPDVTGVPANYPRVWSWTFTRLGWGPARLMPLAFCAIALFASSLLLLRSLLITRGDAVLVYAAAVSPAALLAIERANADIVVFPILCLAMLQRRLWLSGALLGLAAVLKIYPAFALAALVRSRRTLAIALAVGFALLVLGVLYRHDLLLIRRNVPVFPFGAFGIPAYAMGLTMGRHTAMSAGMATGVVAAIALAALACGVVLSRWMHEPDRDPVRAQAMLMSSAIYIACFLVSSNFDYRLIVLIPAVPFLNAWRRAGDRRTAAAGLGALLATGVAMSETPLFAAFGVYGAVVAVGGKILLLALLACGSVMALRVPGGAGAPASKTSSIMQ